MEIEVITKLALSCYDDFIKQQIEDNPELLIKYPISMENNVEFVEAMLVQYWVDENFNSEQILEFISNRYKRLRK